MFVLICNGYDSSACFSFFNELYNKVFFIVFHLEFSWQLIIENKLPFCLYKCFLIRHFVLTKSVARLSLHTFCKSIKEVRVTSL